MARQWEIVDETVKAPHICYSRFTCHHNWISRI